jgi:hypothetical protein
MTFSYMCIMYFDQIYPSLPSLPHLQSSWSPPSSQIVPLYFYVFKKNLYST